MKGKNILIIVLAVILTGSVVFLSVWLSKNWDNVKKALNGTNIYTQTDIDNAYSDGYTTGLADKAKLTAELADAKSKLADAQDQLAVLTSENANLTADKASLKDSLDRAVAECDELKSRISYLEKLLEAYGNIEKISVSYWVDSECVNVELVDAGTTVTGYEPTLEDWQIFQGWALKDSTDVLDLTTTTFSSDTALYVVYDRQEYTVTYNIYSNESTRDTVSQTVKYGDYSTAPTTADRTGYTFLGWAVYGTTDIVDVSTYPITSNTTFVCKYQDNRTWHTVLSETTTLDFEYNEEDGCAYASHLCFVSTSDETYARCSTITQAKIKYTALKYNKTSYSMSGGFGGTLPSTIGGSISGKDNVDIWLTLDVVSIDYVLNDNITYWSLRIKATVDDDPVLAKNFKSITLSEIQLYYV